MLPSSVKHLVIGAGVHGLSTAWHLAEDGEDVLVVDKTGVAAGASGIACGVVRNNYFQPAMCELMAACVEVWESDPEASTTTAPATSRSARPASRAISPRSSSARSGSATRRSCIWAPRRSSATCARCTPTGARPGSRCACTRRWAASRSTRSPCSASPARRAPPARGSRRASRSPASSSTARARCARCAPARGRSRSSRSSSRSARGSRRCGRCSACPRTSTCASPTARWPRTADVDLLVPAGGRGRGRPRRRSSTGDGRPSPVLHVDSDQPLHTDDGALVTDEPWGIYVKPDRESVQGGAAPLRRATSSRSIRTRPAPSTRGSRTSGARRCRTAWALRGRPAAVPAGALGRRRGVHGRQLPGLRLHAPERVRGRRLQPRLQDDRGRPGDRPGAAGRALVAAAARSATSASRPGTCTRSPTAPTPGVSVRTRFGVDARTSGGTAWARSPPPTAWRSSTRTGVGPADRLQPRLAALGRRLGHPDAVLPAPRLPGRRARPARTRPLDADRRRPRHGPLRRRPGRADRAPRPQTRSTSVTPPAAARSCTTSAATVRAASRRPCSSARCRR